MPKILCSCGEVIEDISIPNPNGYLLFSEQTLDLLESNSEANNWDNATLLDAIYERSAQTYKCPRCLQLIVFANGKENPPTYYKAQQ